MNYIRISLKMMKNNKFNILNESDDENDNNVKNNIKNNENDDDGWILNKNSSKNEKSFNTFKQNDKPYNNSYKPYNNSYKQNDKPYNNSYKQNDRPYNNSYNNTYKQNDRPYNNSYKQNDRSYNNSYNRTYKQNDNNDNNDNIKKEELLNKDDLSYKNSSWNKKLETDKWDKNYKLESSNWLSNKKNSDNNDNNVEENKETEIKSRWVQEVSKKKKYDNLPENFALRDLRNKYVIPIGKKSDSKFKSDKNSEENFIRAAQKRLYDSKNVVEALDLCRLLASEYDKKHNNMVSNGGNLYSIDELKKYIICIYVHMLVKNDKNEILVNLFNKLEYSSKTKNDFFELRHFILYSIWNGYTPIQNAAFNLSSSCFDNLILWGSNIDDINIDGETIDDVIDAGFKIISNHKDKVNNIIFYRNAYNVTKDRLAYYKNMKNNKENKEKVVEKVFNMDEINNELKKYSSDELFENYLEDDNDKNYIIIVTYLTTINNSDKCIVFKDWLERYINGSMSSNGYIKLIKKLLDDNHINIELLKEIFDEEILDYISGEAPLIFKEIKLMIN